jgi:ATP adenylyltransferase
MDYIRGSKPKGCVFCNVPAQDTDRDNLILYRGQRCFVIMNRYPYNNGHLMVAPYEHVDSPAPLAAEAQLEMMQLVSLCLTVLKQTMSPDGYNIGMNVGAAAGAGIKDHIHMHIVPRWVGDTNYMPVCADTRVIVEGLLECYDRLKPVFASLRAQAPS